MLSTASGSVSAGILELRLGIAMTLRGWGNYFRTGNASMKFQQVDRCVWVRLHRLLSTRGGDRQAPFNPASGRCHAS
jgi:RNA-directed DNA polymerase